MEWVYDGGKREKWGILRQFSQDGCNFLGQGGDVKWERVSLFLCLDVNETPTPPFI
jgi:hypothetical protein